MHQQNMNMSATSGAARVRRHRLSRMVKIRRVIENVVVDGAGGLNPLNPFHHPTSNTPQRERRVCLYARSNITTNHHLVALTKRRRLMLCQTLLRVFSGVTYLMPINITTMSDPSKFSMMSSFRHRLMRETSTTVTFPTKPRPTLQTFTPSKNAASSSSLHLSSNTWRSRNYLHLLALAVLNSAFRASWTTGHHLHIQNSLKCSNDLTTCFLKVHSQNAGWLTTWIVSRW